MAGKKQNLDAGLLCAREFEEVLLELGWEPVTNWECLFVHRKQGDNNMARKKQKYDSHVDEFHEKRGS